MRKLSHKKNRIRSEARTLALTGGVLTALCGAFVAVAIYLDPSIDREARARVRRAQAKIEQTIIRAAVAVSNSVIERPYFAVQEIKVFGAHAADRADIIANAGLERGLSSWRVDPDDLERRIRRHPWIKRVVVRRELPRRVIIAVEEWQARGIVALDSLYYVNRDGVVFKPVDETDAVDFPFITGLRAADLRPHDPLTRRKLAEVLAFGQEVERAGLRLSEIRFDAGGNIVLYPASARVPFTMGWGQWDGKLARLKRFLQEWNGQEAHFAAVDMSFAGQAVARLRKSL